MKRVLVLDDDEDFLELYKDTLTEAGFEVSLHSSALTAVEYLEHSPVQAIITDLKMPGINGINFFRLVESKGLLIHPFVVISGYYEDRDSNLRYLGVDKVFQKPVKFDKLIAYIDEFITNGYAI